jgi:hypothetical protein
MAAADNTPLNFTRSFRAELVTFEVSSDLE